MPAQLGSTSLTHFLGLRSQIQPERMKLGDLVTAINIRVDETAQLARRAGRIRIGTQAAHSLWGDGPLTFAVVAGSLSRIARVTYEITPLVPDIVGPVSYARLDRRVFWSDGARCGVIDLSSGLARSWGLSVPDSYSVSASGGGALPAGRYQYAVTWLRSDGQESGARESQVIDVPADGALSATVSAGDDPDVIGAMLYLSTPGGSTLYRALTITPAGGTRVYTGNTSELHEPLATQFLRAPPVGSVIAVFAGRVWVAFEDYLLPSEAFSPELFDLRQDVPMPDTVTMLAPLESQAGMFVGTASGCGFLRGQNPAELHWEPGNDDPVLAGSITRVPGAQFADGALDGQMVPVWAGTQGLYAGMPDGKVRTLTADRHPLTLSGRAALGYDDDLKTVLLSSA